MSRGTGVGEGEGGRGDADGLGLFAHLGSIARTQYQQIGSLGLQTLHLQSRLVHAACAIAFHVFASLFRLYEDVGLVVRSPCGGRPCGGEAHRRQVLNGDVGGQGQLRTATADGKLDDAILLADVGQGNLDGVALLVAQARIRLGCQ